MSFRVIVLLACCFTCALLLGQDELQNKNHSEDEPLEKLQVHPPDPDDTEPLMQAVENQLTALRAKDIPRAYFSYTSREFRRVTSLNDFKQLVNNYTALSKNKAITPQQVLIQKGVGYYTGVITSTDGTAMIIHYNLIYEDAEWKVLAIKVEPLVKH